MIVRLFLLLLTCNVAVFSALSNDSGYQNTLTEAKSLLRKNIEKSLELSFQLESIALSNNDADQLAQAYWMIGYIYELKDEVAKASLYYHHGADIYRELDESNLALNLYRQNGRTKLNHGLYQLALQEYTRGEDLLNQIDDYQLQSDYLFDKSLCQAYLRKYDEAIRGFLQSKRVLVASGSVADTIRYSKIHTEIGLIFESLAIHTPEKHFHDSAMNHYLLAREFANASLYEFRFHNNAAVVLMNTGRLDTASRLLQRSLKIAENINTTKLIIPSLNNLGILHYNQRDPITADSLFRAAINLNVLDYTVEEMIQDIHLPLVINNTGELIRSYEYLDSLEQMKLPSREGIRGGFSMAPISNRALIDRLKQIENAERAAKLEEVHLAYEEEMDQLQRERDRKERWAAFWKWTSITGGIAILIGLLFSAYYFFWIYRPKKRAIKNSVARLKQRIHLN